MVAALAGGRGRGRRSRLVAAAVAAALAYSVAPRQYTAVATVHVDPDLITVSRGNPTTPAQDAARGHAAAIAEKHELPRGGPQLRGVAQRAVEHPGRTLFEPVSAELVPGTSTVRVKFTDPSRDAARAGADATVQALNPVVESRAQEAAMGLSGQRMSAQRQLAFAERQLATPRRSGGCVSIAQKELRQTLENADFFLSFS